MNTTEIIELFKRNKSVAKVFCGVYSVDKLPTRKIHHRPCALIVNTDESSEPGEHWLAIYLPKFSNAEYFDSYGVNVSDQRIVNFLKLNSKRFIFNQKAIQSNESTNCGLFCMGYIYFRANNYSMKQYLRFFSKEKYYNDLFIEKLFEQM